MTFALRAKYGDKEVGSSKEGQTSTCSNCEKGKYASDEEQTSCSKHRENVASDEQGSNCAKGKYATSAIFLRQLESTVIKRDRHPSECPIVQEYSSESWTIILALKEESMALRRGKCQLRRWKVQ